MFQQKLRQRSIQNVGASEFDSKSDAAESEAAEPEPDNEQDKVDLTRDLCSCHNNLFLMQEVTYTEWLKQLGLAESDLTEGMSFVAICLAFG